MEKIKFTLFAFFLLLGTFTGFSGNNEVPSDIINALNKGNAAELSSFLNDNVELVIENKNDIFSKQQASSIISDFFRKNSVSGFNQIHKGEKEASSFVIGTLKTSGGNFRVYILTRKSSNKDVIQQLRIEPSND